MKRIRIFVSTVFAVTPILCSPICFASLGPARSHFQSALAAAEKGNFDQAIEHLKNEIGEDSSFAEASLRLADFFRYANQLTSGENYFKDAISRTPENASVQLGYALISHYLKNEERAFEHARLALDYGAVEPAAIQLLVESAMQSSNIESLQAIFRRLKKNSAQSHLSDFGYALWKFRTDNLTSAKSSLLTYLNTRSDGFAYQLLGDAHLKSAELSAATSAYSRALQLSGNEPKWSQISVLRSLGTVYFQRSEYDSADYYLTLALKRSKEFSNLIEQLEIQSTLIQLYHDSQRYAAALDHGSEAIALATRLHENHRLPDLYIALAAAYEQVGDYQRALINYRSAASDSSARTASALNDAGRMLAQLGHWPSAADYFERSMSAAARADLMPVKFLALLNLADLHLLQGDWEHARDEYSRVLQFAQDAENRNLAQACLLKLVNLHLRYLRDLDSAGHYLILADAAAKQTLNLQNAANIRWMQGRLTLAHRNIEKAETYFLDAIQLGREIGSTVSILAGNAGLIETYLQAGFYDLAAARADSALKLLEEIGFLYVYDRDAEFFDLKNDLISSAIAAYSAVRQDSKIYHAVEMCKALQHVRDLSAIRYLIRLEPPNDMRWKLDAYDQKINAEWKELWSAWRSDQQDNIDMGAQIKNEIIKLEKERLLYRRELLQSNPEFYSIIQPMAASVDDLKRRLADLNSVFVHYFVGEKATDIIVVRADSVFHHREDCGAAYLKNLIEQINPVFSDIGNLSTSSDTLDKQFRLDLAGELYQTIFTPIEKHLPKNCALIISPDDILNRVPWECLVSNKGNLIDIYDDKSARFLVEDHAVSYVPYAKFLDWPYKKERRKQKSLIAFSETGGVANGGNHSNNHHNGVSKPQREAKLIAQLVGLADVCSGEDATKRQFVERAANYKAIHLSQPSIIENGSPLYSKFYFGNSDTGRDSIESREFFDLQLTADLMVLSNVSRPPRTHFEREARGLSGLLHALNYSGVNALALNLWQADEKSKTDLLLSFYGRLTTGSSTAAALQQAKLARMAEGKRNPIYWAGLIVYGSPTAVKFDRSNLGLIIVAAIIGVALLGLMVIRHYFGGAGRHKTG